MLGIYTAFSRIDVGTFRLFWEDGIRVFSQQLFSGGLANHQGLMNVGGANLRDARAIGMTTIGYIVSPPSYPSGGAWYPQSLGLERARDVAGAEWQHLRAVFVDLETMLDTPGGTECWPTQKQALVMLDELKPMNIEAGIYTSSGFWALKYGGSTDPGWLQWKLMDALWDGDPNIISAFGPWGVEDIIGKQYTGTQSVNGVNICYESWDAAWIGGYVPEPVAESLLEQRVIALEKQIEGFNKSFQDSVNSDHGNALRIIRDGLLALPSRSYIHGLRAIGRTLGQWVKG